MPVMWMESESSLNPVTFTGAGLPQTLWDHLREHQELGVGKGTLPTKGLALKNDSASFSTGRNQTLFLL
jgi:hypothetical protein